MLGRATTPAEGPFRKTGLSLLVNSWETVVLLLVVGLVVGGLERLQQMWPASPADSTQNAPVPQGLFLDECRDELWVLRKGWGISRLRLPHLWETEFVPIGNRFQEVVIQPLPQRCLMATYTHDSVSLALDDHRGQASYHITPPASITALDISRKGHVLFADVDGQLHHWTPRDDTWDHELHQTGLKINHLLFNPVGDAVAFIEPGASVRLWDLASRTVRQAWSTNHPHCSRLAWSPCGQKLATVGTDGMLRLWDTRGGTCLWEVRADVLDPSTVAFSPCGQTLATGGFEGQVRLWQVTTGRMLAQWSGHKVGVLVLVWAKDSRTLYSGGLDGEVRRWQLPDNL